VSVCRRIDAAGHAIRLAPDAIVLHKIQPERLSKQTFFRRAFHQGRSDAMLDQGSARAMHARVRQLVEYVSTARTDPGADAFDARCRRRLLVGYLSQMLGLYDGAGGPKRRAIRGLSELVSSFVGQAAVSSARLRDLSTDRDNWRQLARDRQAELERQAAASDEPRRDLRQIRAPRWWRIRARLRRLGRRGPGGA
jgi:hypothetical protein